jgi:ferrous iron transport protein A
MSPAFVIGQAYKIRRLPNELNSSYRSKLLSMGLMPGTTIMVERIAPLGGPVQLRVNNFALSLRQQELAQLELEAL